MFVFGVRIDAQEVFDRHCLPAISAYGGSDATLLTSHDTPIAATYNAMLDSCVGLPDVEAVVLLRENVEITDPDFVAKVRAAFAADPRLAVLGPADPGGAPPRWWQAPRRAAALGGHEDDANPGHTVGRDVDSVDGACMILRPEPAARLRFDDATFTGPSGYDVDFCFRMRGLGHRVAVAPIAVVQHAVGAPADGDDAFRNAAAAWQGRRAAHLHASLVEALAHQDEAVQEPRTALGSAPEPAPEPAPEADLDVADLLDHLPPRIERVLDVGCGTGRRGLAIKRSSGAHVTGIAHSEQAAHVARTRLDEVQTLDLTTARELPWRPAPYDLVVLADTLARTVDPEAVLRLLVPHLSPEGRVLLTVPNVKHWSVLLPLLLEDRWEYQESGALQEANLRFFTMVEIATLLREVGLGVLETCAAQQLPLADESRLEPLLAAIEQYGADPVEAGTLLNSYQYVIVARRG